jgi:hypothetical protein
MTSATSSRPTRSAPGRTARVAAAALGLAGALTLTACSGDGGSGDDSAPSPSASATADADTGGGSGASASASGSLEGSWFTTSKGKAVVLAINGKQAGLFSTGGIVCGGTAGEEAGMEMIHLKCKGGSEKRTTGMVDSASKTTLKVTWEGGLGQETYTKAEGGKLPSGLPTARLGS